MSFSTGSTTEDPQYSHVRRNNGLTLTIAGLAWLSYLLAQCGALALGIDSVQGALMRISAAAFYIAGVILLCVAFRSSAPLSALAALILNLIAAVFFIRGVGQLLSIQPDQATMDNNYIQAQVLMSIAMFFIARCVHSDQRFPRWIVILIYLYSLCLIANITTFLTGLGLHPASLPVVTVIIGFELLFALMMIRVGVNQMLADRRRG